VATRAASSLCTASTAAAIAVKHGWSRTQIGHRSVLWDAAKRAAREGVHGARGLFDDVDAVVTGTRGSTTMSAGEQPGETSGAKFRFHGVAGPRSRRPIGDVRRSTPSRRWTMVNMMRGHVPQGNAHSTTWITDGGKAAERGARGRPRCITSRDTGTSASRRDLGAHCECGEGRGFGTGTTMDMEIISAVYNVLPNGLFSDGLQRKNSRRSAGIVYTPTSAAFAEQIRKTLTEPCSSGAKRRSSQCAGRADVRLNRHGRRELGGSDGAALDGDRGCRNARA
jgi:hypothetical protein